MPKIAEERPEMLQPYLFHGLELGEGSEEAVGECVFCGKEKFSANARSGLWQCFVCGERGNLYTFLRQLWEVSYERTTDYEDLRKNRRLLYTETLEHFGLCRSIGNGKWIMPGYGANGKLQQLYTYLNTPKGWAWFPTPTLDHQLLGRFDLTSSKHIYVCEGPWDMMALWEVMRYSRVDGERIVSTSSNTDNLLAVADVVAAPTCTSFDDRWASVFEGRAVTLLYDSDHPGENNKPPAGYAGMKRVAGIIAGANPTEIRYIDWGTLGYDPALPSGYDIRDVLKEGHSISERTHLLQAILDRLKEVPEDWKKAKAKGTDSINCTPCTSYKELVAIWRRALKWVPGLDHALVFMLAVVASTKAVGDQLWGKVLSPAGGGKTTLAEALAVSKKYVVAKSSITGFHSGYTDKEGKEDNSLIPHVMGKTLIIKDGDTLLQKPNLGQILSEARDLYDSTSRVHYRNKRRADYQGVRMTFLLCGTSSLRSIDSSELGERFLDCVIMEGIDDDLEDEVLVRVAHRSKRNMTVEANGTPDTHYDGDLFKAMSLTGGYVNYLRDNAPELLAQIDMDDFALAQCIHYGKFVAFMRARPSLRQEETAEREFGSRLVSQLVRLATCLAVVLNKRSVDKEVLSRTRQVALDTARGKVFEMAKHLYEHGMKGSEVRAISLYTNQSEDRVRKLLRFLKAIGVVEPFTVQLGSGVQSRPKWRLTKRLYELYKKVLPKE